MLALISYAVYKYYFDRLEIIEDKPFTKGYSVENIELKITDEKGQLSAKFKAPNIISYTDSPIINISTPLFWTYKKGVQQWVLKSNKAEYNSSESTVLLSEKVMAQTIGKDNDSNFEANNLLVNLTTNMATTNDGIKFKQDLFNMTGQIATFNLEKEILEVNNNIKAVYKASAKNREKK